MKGKPKTSRSQQLYAEALRLMPGGVNSPVRAFRAVGGIPIFMSRGQGCRLWDADGNEYIDFVGSWGPLILGHAHPEVVTAIQAVAEKGTSFGAPTELEVELAREITSALPSVELVRLVNSGTEATMSALRLARAFTGRNKALKFSGGYHGHGDAFLAQAGSGLATLGIPASPGIPQAWARETLVVPYNDLSAVEEAFAAYPGDIAAVIVEPVAGNMGVVPPAPGFLEGLRQLTRSYGALLIFDEVITGFRVTYGGAQARYGVTPDLTCLGKIIGGGLPVGAYGGRKEIMELMAPQGSVYQAGTLSGNPLAVAAGLATLKCLKEPGVYERLEQLGATLESGLKEAAARAEVPTAINRVASLLTLFFHPGPVRTWEEAKASDTKRFAAFFHSMLRQGIYLPPSQFEAWFLSLAYTDADIEATVTAASRALREAA